MIEDLVFLSDGYRKKLFPLSLFIPEPLVRINNKDMVYIFMEDEFIVQVKKGKLGTLLIISKKSKSEVILDGDILKEIRTTKKRKISLTYSSISVFKIGIFECIPKDKVELLDIFWELIKNEELVGYVVKDKRVIDLGSFSSIIKFYIN
ncbi:MAG: hypothetical protein ABDH37_07645 [Candidatus Hydrothermales bacterium]